MEKEQLIINNLGFEIGAMHLAVAEYKAEVEILNNQLKEKDNIINNLQKTIDSLQNSVKESNDE